MTIITSILPELNRACMCRTALSQKASPTGLSWILAHLLSERWCARCRRSSSSLNGLFRIWPTPKRTTQLPFVSRIQIDVSPDPVADRKHTHGAVRLGVRFFDFRPGYNFYDAVKAEKKEIRHQHAIVPGEEYVSFLTSILRFLAKNRCEIVLVELKKDGFVLPEDKFDKEGKRVAISMIPSVQELQACLDQACVAAGGSDIRVGGAGDLDTSVGQLIERQTRLIIVDRVRRVEVV